MREGARLSLDIDLPGGLGRLRLAVDDDADGAVDRRLKFRPVTTGRGANDQLAPKVKVAARPFAGPSGEPLVEVRIHASEPGGSEVARTEYAVDPAGVAGTYDGPFVVPADGTLIVRAVDRAGNVTAPHVRVALG